MKKIIYLTLTFFMIGCSSNDSLYSTSKLPSSIHNLDEAKQKVLGKTWEVIDIGVMHINNANNKDYADISWITEDKTMDDYTKNALDKFQGTKMDINTDGTGSAFIEDFVLYGKQTFNVADEKGLQLQIMGDSAQSATYGKLIEYTFSFKILGLDDSKLFLETSTEINRKKAVLLLQAK